MGSTDNRSSRPLSIPKNTIGHKPLREQKPETVSRRVTKMTSNVKVTNDHSKAGLNRKSTAVGSG